MRKIGELGTGLLHHDVRALIVATTASLEEACGWRTIPAKPFAVSHLDPSEIAKLRASDDIESSRLLRAYTESAVARSFAISDNIARMRSTLHLLRFWRQIQRQNPDDKEAADAVLKVWEFCKEHWGIQHPPTDPREWDSYCEAHVTATMRRKERCS